MFTLQSQHHGVVWGRQGWSTSILERKLTAQYRPREESAVWHQSNMSSLQMDTAAGWSASAQRLDHDGLSEKEHINFIEPHMRPPNSPDINPVDYAIWGAHQQRVYHQRQLKTVELKWAIVTEWQKLSQRFIDNSINEWHRRLEAVIKNGGRHIEHRNLVWAAAHHFNTIVRSLVNKTEHLTLILE